MTRLCILFAEENDKGLIYRKIIKPFYIAIKFDMKTFVNGDFEKIH